MSDDQLTDAATSGGEPLSGATLVEEPQAPVGQPELSIGSLAAADSPVEPRPQPILRGRIDKHGVACGTGRRKTAVARVRIQNGTGQFIVNGRPFEEYFPIERDRELILLPLRSTDMLGKVDIQVRVNGGGSTGQTGAVVLGISRALQTRNPGLHDILSGSGFLTRDGRAVERKKYGFKKARRSFQFSKR